MYNGVGGMYETGKRFSLAGWSADEWATFFSGASQSVSQLYGTVAGRPVAPIPAPVVTTPIGAVPQWLVPVALIGGVFLLANRRR